MSWLSKIILLCVALGLFPSAYSSDSVNLLVMIEDGDKEAVSRHSLINKRVHASVSQQLIQIADVYDETSISLDSFKQGRTGRSDAEILDIARSITRPPIDVVVVLSTYVTVQTNQYVKKASARITGRLLNAQSGQFLDNFEVQSPASWTIPYECKSQTCMLEEMGDEAKVLGDELGLILAEKLNWQMNATETENGTNKTAQMTNDFYMEFDGFSAQEVASIEEYLLVFSGYVSHRPTQQRYTRTTLLYRSTISSAKLSRNLMKVLAELNMRAIINFEGNSFNLKRITFRGENPSRDVTQGW